MYPEKPFSLDKSHYPSTKQLRQLYDSSLDIICAINQERKFVYMNQSCKRILGYAPEEMIAQNVQKFIYDEDKELTTIIGEAILKGEDKTNFVNRIYSRDGSIVTISWSAHWDATEKLMFCIGRDVTEINDKQLLHAAYEAKIKKQHHEMQEMLERMMDGFYALDNQWNIIYINKRCEKILGIKREDYLSRNLWECFPELIDSVVQEQYAKAMALKVPVHFDLFLNTFNNWFEVNAYPSHTGLSVFFKDIGEQKKSHHRLTNVLERMNQGFYSVDKDFKVTYWNRMAEKIIGVSKEEALGKRLTEIYSKEAISVYQQLYSHIAQDNSPLHAEHICPQNNRWIQLSIYPSDEGFSAFFKDIHEQKQIEEDLIKLSLIAKETMSAVIVSDLDFKIQWVNDAFVKVTGYTNEDTIGKTPGEILDCAETSKETLAFIKEKLQKGESFNVELLNRTKNNGRIWWEIHHQPVRDSKGEIVRYFSICTDITERKRVENELNNLSLVAKETEESVAILNEQDEIIWVNDAFSKKTGYSLDETLGRKPSDLLSGPETNKETLKQIDSAFKNNHSVDVELINYKKNGEKFWVALHGQPVFDENGNIKQYFSVRRDITKRKMLELALESQRKKTTAAVINAQERERTLVGRELHDNVNQVLTSVKLYQELILSGVKNKEELLKRSAELLQDSINEIRSLSRRLSAPTLGKMRLKDSINELVQTISTTNKFQISLETKKIDSLDIDEEIHLAIFRIIQEHLTNILKHAEASHVKVLLDYSDANLIIKITDNGKGFDTNQKRPGIGITNMIMRAESFNGLLTIESEPSLGCTLMATFPLIG